ncbi:hypothetical protein, partial [Heyndrickxia coagulans]|uniref:hypothetical protein n=1 Tax=Heyndrickxia coagulans TaxID=1398 RepID=UPI002285D6A8
KSKNGHDLEGFNDEEQEVLFKRNTAYKILSSQFMNGRVIFELEEILWIKIINHIPTVVGRIQLE